MESIEVFDEILHFCPPGISEGHIPKGKNVKFLEKIIDSKGEKFKVGVVIINKGIEVDDVTIAIGRGICRIFAKLS